MSFSPPRFQPALRLVLAFLLASASARAARVAVLDFRSGTETVSLQFLAQTLPNALVEPLSNQPGIEVVERSQLSRLLQEHQLSLTGLALPDSARALLPADILVLGQFGGTMDAVQLQVRVVGCGDGSVKGAFSRQGTLQEILSGMPTLAAQVGMVARGESSGTLTLHSAPQGATVWLDGRILGRTPLVDQKIAAGRHALRLEKENSKTWSDSVTIEPAGILDRSIALAEDDDRSGLWIQAGATTGGFARGFSDPRGPLWGGDVGFLARSHRLGVQFLYELPTDREYDVTFPVPWGERTLTRVLTGPLVHLQLVGDVVQAGRTAVHVGGGLCYGHAEVSPLDLSDPKGATKGVGILGAIVSGGVRWRLHRSLEILAESEATTSFDQVTVTDISERDLFSTSTSTSKFTLQTWSARIAARFRIL